MRKIDKANFLLKFKNFCKENNLDISACGCCGGYHLIWNNEEIMDGCLLSKDIDDTINYFKKYNGKIFVEYFDNKFTKIDMIKVDNKIVNLGGKSYPFSKFTKRMNHEQLREFLDYFI